MATIAFDTETTGLRLHHSAHMFAFSECGWGGVTSVHRFDRSRPRYTKADVRLRELCSGENTLVMHNAKFDMTAAGKHLGMFVPDHTKFHDTYLQSHMLQNDHLTHRLKDLAWELARIPKDDEAEVKAIVRDGGDYSMVPEELMEKYQRRDAYRCMVLHRFFFPQIRANRQMLDVYQNELDLVPVTMRMESRGIMLDRARCTAMHHELRQKAFDAVDELEALCGRRVNPKSGPQVEWLLYKYLGRAQTAFTSKGNGKTDKHVILAMREEDPHPALDLVMQYRSYMTGSQMMLSYLEAADEDGILHPSINTCQAVTGRESCSDPNLQNVQKDQALLNPFPVPARRVFRPRPGYVNIHIDYSGIELRLLVHYSRDAKLIKILNEGGDPHGAAALVFYGDEYRQALGTSYGSVLRGAAKNANFAIPYGASAVKVAKTLGKSIDYGRQRFALYKQEFPGLVGLTPRIMEVVRDQGHVVTLFGRKLRVSKEKAYSGTNYLIQGTAADILKRAQVRVSRVLDEATSGECQILLPIHDEVVIEWPRTRLRDLNDVLRRVRQVMIDFPMFDVPLEIECSMATRDWANKKEIHIAA